MKAIVLEAFGDESHFREKDVPIPSPKEREVRIKIKAASFNPVDYKIRKGAFGGNTPTILGSDCSGVIDALGAGPCPFAIGDEVYALTFGQSSNGSYAEYVSLPIEFVSKKPRSLSFEAAAAVPLVSLTAYRSVIATGALAKAGPIFIAGAAGGVGFMATELTRHFHDGPIYSIAGSEESLLCMTEKQGIKRENIILYQGLSTQQIKERLMAINQNSLFSSTFDFVGKEMKDLCMQLTAYEGHFVTIVPEEPGYSIPVWTRGESPSFAKNLSLHFIFVGAESFSGKPDLWKIYKYHLSEIAELIESKAIHAPAYQTIGSLSVETVQKGHRLLEKGRVKGKLVMQVS